jgi:chemotaxis response regulator CheB
VTDILVPINDFDLPSISVFWIYEDPFTHKSASTFFHSEPDIHFSGAAPFDADSIKAVSRVQPDIAILAVQSGHGLDFIGTFKERWPATPLVVVIKGATEQEALYYGADEVFSDGDEPCNLAYHLREFCGYRLA